MSVGGDPTVSIPAGWVVVVTTGRVVAQVGSRVTTVVVAGRVAAGVDVVAAAVVGAVDVGEPVVAAVAEPLRPAKSAKPSPALAATKHASVIPHIKRRRNSEPVATCTRRTVRRRAGLGRSRIMIASTLTTAQPSESVNRRRGR
jgi:hypothetical protein